LQSFLNAAARVIACLRKFDHVTNALKELHWLPVEQRKFFKINVVCFKVLNNLAPSYLTELLRVYEPVRRLRSSSDKWRFAIEPYSPGPIDIWTQSFFSHCPPDLPMAITPIDNINIFKSKLKTFLFKQAYAL